MPTLEAPVSAEVTDKPPDPVDEQALATRRTDPVDQLPRLLIQRVRAEGAQLKSSSAVLTWS